MKSASSISSAERDVEDLLAALLIGPQPLFLAVAVAADDRRCGIEDHLGRSVVLLEPHRRGVGKIVLEVEDVAQVGAAPLVDRLIRIADNGEILVDAGELLDQQILRPVGVLVLVDHHEAELLRVEIADALAAGDQVERLEQQIVEIERAGLGERAAIEIVDLADLRVTDVPAGALHALGRFHAVFRLADAAERRPGLDHLVVDIQRLQRLLDDRQLIGRIVDDEIAGQADRRRLAPQQPRAQRVKGREPDLPAVLAQGLLDALPHLFRGLVGERDREHFIRPGDAAADQMRDARGDHARLAGAGAGQDQQGPIGMLRGPALFRIQRVEEIHGSLVRPQAQAPGPRSLRRETDE